MGPCWDGTTSYCPLTNFVSPLHIFLPMLFNCFLCYLLGTYKPLFILGAPRVLRQYFELSKYQSIKLSILEYWWTLWWSNWLFRLLLNSVVVHCKYKSGNWEETGILKWLGLKILLSLCGCFKNIFVPNCFFFRNTLQISGTSNCCKYTRIVIIIPVTAVKVFFNE